MDSHTHASIQVGPTCCHTMGWQGHREHNAASRGDTGACRFCGGTKLPMLHGRTLLGVVTPPRLSHTRAQYLGATVTLTRAAVRASSSCECSRSCSASTSPLSAWIAASLAANSRWYSCAAACTWAAQQQGDHAWSTGESSVESGNQVIVCMAPVHLRCVPDTPAVSVP